MKPSQRRSAFRIADLVLAILGIRLGWFRFPPVATMTQVIAAKEAFHGG
jgi:hypothetical protein